MIADTFPNGLRPPQLAGALTIAQQRRVLLADQPGAGKTAQALVALELAGLLNRRANILILAPQTACQLTWASELTDRLGGQHDVEVADLTAPHLNSRTGLPKKSLPSLRERDIDLQAAAGAADIADLPLIVLANFEQVRWDRSKGPAVPSLQEVVWDALIIDEAHLILPTTEDDARTMTLVWRGLTRLRTSDGAIRLAMSGTPDRGKLENRYGTYKFLWPTEFQNYWGWLRNTFVVTMDEVRAHGRTIRIPQVGKLRRPDDWTAFERAHMLRRTKSEMLRGLPEKQWANEGAIDLPLTAAQAAGYREYETYLAERAEQLVDAGEENKAAALRLAFYTRARQLATCTWDFEEVEDVDRHTGEVTLRTHGTPLVRGPEHSNKLAWILDFLEQRGHTAGNWDPALGKVVIVSYFTQVLRWLRAELEAAGIHAELLTGEQNQVEKKAVESAFQRGDLRIVLLSGHLGVSINLDAADDMVFVDAVNDPDMLEQAEDRIHRASRNHQVTYWRLASAGTMDQAVLMDVDQRYRATRERYDGDRGVQFARRMMPKTRTMERATA